MKKEQNQQLANLQETTKKESKVKLSNLKEKSGFELGQFIVIVALVSVLLVSTLTPTTGQVKEIGGKSNDTLKGISDMMDSNTSDTP